MEEVKTDPVDQTQEASGSEANQVKDNKDSVAYESYKKVLNEKRNYMEKVEALNAEREQERQARMIEEGKIKEALDLQIQKNKELEEKARQREERYQWEKVTGSIKSEALKVGCLNPDKLIRLLDKQDFETLRAEDGEIRAESLNQLMEKVKRENDFLFKKASVQVNDATPASGVPRMDKTENELFADYIKNLT